MADDMKAFLETPLADEIARLRDLNASLAAERDELLAALEDMLGGWRYIRQTHGDLYGVGWERAEQAAVAAISKAKGATHADT